MHYHWDWGVFFKPTGVGSEIYLNWFVSGLMMTLGVALSAWVIALVLGTVLGVMRSLPGKIASRIAGAYVDLFRNVPLLVQLFVWYYVIPDWLPDNLSNWLKQDISPVTNAFITVTVCLGLFTAARVCEQVRTGIQALPKGQSNAGLALGLPLAQVYRHVLLPQAFRIIIPPLTSEFLNIIKNSSVASLVALPELLAQTKQLVDFTANQFEAYTVGTLIYFAVNMLLMFFMRWVEKRLRVPGLIALGGK
ncbi:glutamate/aspartate transport system permease protein [Silvimonas terrae]|uniref:Glutamate/aspartate transport system permease protein n=1 Tax=Silvimonas terrae TaxID=300266 RepID=A0A840RIU0_9NEIS|nr:amino acid ABC transporter permease [Silvimonas terrae]MBB5193027.1 glutamate/aspartate transport system permease protein [Silvimonas terrae]